MTERQMPYAKRGRGWAKRLGIGGVLLFLAPFLLGLTLLPVLGYLARASRAIRRGEPEPPAWDEWGVLLRDGARCGAAITVLLVVVLTVGYVLSIVLNLPLADVIDPVGSGQALVVPALWTAPLPVGLLVLLTLFVLPVVLVRVADARSVVAGLQSNAVAGELVDDGYLSAWMRSALLACVFLPLGALLWPVLLGPVVAFAGFLTVTYRFTDRLSDPVETDVDESLDGVLREPP